VHSKSAWTGWVAALIATSLMSAGPAAAATPSEDPSVQAFAAKATDDYGPGYTGDGGEEEGFEDGGAPVSGEGPIERSPTAGGDAADDAHPLQSQSDGSSSETGGVTSEDSVTSGDVASRDEVSGYEATTRPSVMNVTLARTGLPILPLAVLSMTCLGLGSVGWAVRRRREFDQR